MKVKELILKLQEAVKQDDEVNVDVEGTERSIKDVDILNGGVMILTRNINYAEIAKLWIDGGLRGCLMDSIVDLETYNGVLQALIDMGNPYNSIATYKRICGRV